MKAADGLGLLAVQTESVSPREVKLVEQTVCERFTEEQPKRMIGDTAYESDSLNKQFKKFDIELIAPHKTNRKMAKTQDGEKLRRYKRRWRTERLCA